MIFNGSLLNNRTFLLANSFWQGGFFKVNIFIFLMVFIYLAPQALALNLGYDAEWEDVVGAEWQGEVLREGKYDISRRLAYAYIDIAHVERRWLRVSASGRADSPDFNVWIHVFNKNGHSLFRPLPTRCGIERGVKVCSNFSWIPEGGSQVRASFYNGSGEGGVEIESMKIERSTSGERRNSELERFNGVLLKIKDLYYLSGDVDWGVIESDLEYAMSSPSGMDPVPGVIAVLIGRLPENRHMFIFGNHEKSGDFGFFPACHLIGSGFWKINIPAAVGDEASLDEYVARAHDCFRKEYVESWIVNLTNNQGGDVFAQFAALAPVIRGRVGGFENGSGKIFQLSVDGQGVRLDGRIVRSVESKQISGQSIFIFDESCGSSCEALAISVKGKFKTLGRRTAGLTTVNETIKISEDFFLALTSGWMVDRDGKKFDAVEPDLNIGNEDIERVIGIE